MEKPGLRVSPHLRVSAGIVSIAAYKNYTTRARARVGPELIPAIPAYPQSKKQVAAGMRGYEFRQQQQKRARRSKGRGENNTRNTRDTRKATPDHDRPSRSPTRACSDHSSCFVCGFFSPTTFTLIAASPIKLGTEMTRFLCRANN